MSPEAAEHWGNWATRGRAAEIFAVAGDSS